MGRTTHLSWRAAALAVVVAVAGAGAAWVPVSAAGGWRQSSRELRPGVTHLELTRRSPNLVVNVARIAPDAGVHLRPVLAYDRVGDEDRARPRETTSAMCARAGGVVCVNADFAACTPCRQPFGGVVVDDRVLRSFHPHHEQFSVTDAGFSLALPSWHGSLRAVYTWRGTAGALAPRTETRELPLQALNTDATSDAAVLYTPDWGETTPAVEARTELLVRTNGPVRPGEVEVEVMGRRGAGGQLDHAAAAVSTGGSMTAEVDRFLEEWRSSDADEKRLVIATGIDGGVRQSVGGHPVLLRGGRHQALNQEDGKVTGRHPRTLVGWTAQRQLLIVTVDGRQPGRSDGVTLADAVRLLEQLGAVDAINLDGGGSTTFVGPCTTGQCVLNRPSDGSERRVPVALAVIAPEGTRPIPHFAPVAKAEPAPVAPAPRVAPAPVEPAPPAPAAPPPPPAAPEPAPPPAPSAVEVAPVELQLHVDAPPATAPDPAAPEAAAPSEELAGAPPVAPARAPARRRPPLAATALAVLSLAGSASWLAARWRAGTLSGKWPSSPHLSD